MVKVAVIGSGAREHALVRALRRGGNAREIVAIPGNPGIAREVRCVPAQPSLVEAALAEKPDLVVVGPEQPLADGFADRMAAEKVPCFGPVAAAARIEASKAFAKEIMLAAGVPTPRAEVFEDPAAAREYAIKQGACVVKLDGLAAGKGVIVADDGAQAAHAVEELWRPGAKLLIEERLEGGEISIIALWDGESVLPLPPARGHKRLLDGDQRANTGGMGAVCPPSDATPELLEKTVRTVLQPTVRELARRGTPFVGALYAGLMLTSRGPRVLEFNCRLGDPEAQAILPRLRGDLLPLLLASAQGGLSAQELSWDPRTAVAVVLAASGYPGTPRGGDEVGGLREVQQSDDLWILHAGTKAKEGKVVTAGGRLLTVVALGAGAAEARARAYEAAGRIRIEGAQMRRDIGAGEA